MRVKTLVVLAAGLGLLSGGCGSDDSDDSSVPGFYISISGLSFSPLELAVPPGATVTVLNRDADAHSVTSQTSAGAFEPGGVAGITFDTGIFTGSASFTVPSNAPEGTVVPYYCSSHLDTMVTPTGTIRIAAGAEPGPAPDGGGGGY
jgi:plastocyanin